MMLEAKGESPIVSQILQNRHNDVSNDIEDCCSDDKVTSFHRHFDNDVEMLDCTCAEQICWSDGDTRMDDEDIHDDYYDHDIPMVDLTLDADTDITMGPCIVTTENESYKLTCFQEWREKMFG